LCGNNGSSHFSVRSSIGGAPFLLPIKIYIMIHVIKDFLTKARIDI